MTTASTDPVSSGYVVSVSYSGSDASAIYSACADTSAGSDLSVFWWNGSAYVQLDVHLQSFTSSSVQVAFPLQAAIGSAGVAGTDANYYLAYGNPSVLNQTNNSASTISGTKNTTTLWRRIYSFADDFLGTSLDSTVWVNSTNATVGSSVATLSATSPTSGSTTKSVRSSAGPCVGGTIAQMYGIQQISTNINVQSAFYSLSASNNMGVWSYPQASNTAWGLRWKNPTVGSALIPTPPAYNSSAPNTSHTFAFARDTSGNMKGFVDGSVVSGTSVMPTDTQAVSLWTYNAYVNGGATSIISADWVIVRPWTPTEPTVTPGAYQWVSGEGLIILSDAPTTAMTGAFDDSHSSTPLADSPQVVTTNQLDDARLPLGDALSSSGSVALEDDLTLQDVLTTSVSATDPDAPLVSGDTVSQITASALADALPFAEVATARISWFPLYVWGSQDDLQLTSVAASGDALSQTDQLTPSVLLLCADVALGAENWTLTQAYPLFDSGTVSDASVAGLTNFGQDTLTFVAGSTLTALAQAPSDLLIPADGSVASFARTVSEIMLSGDQSGYVSGNNLTEAVGVVADTLGASLLVIPLDALLISDTDSVVQQDALTEGLIGVLDMVSAQSSVLSPDLVGSLDGSSYLFLLTQADGSLPADLSSALVTSGVLDALLSGDQQTAFSTLAQADITLWTAAQAQSLAVAPDSDLLTGTDALGQQFSLVEAESPVVLLDQEDTAAVSDSGNHTVTVVFSDAGISSDALSQVSLLTGAETILVVDLSSVAIAAAATESRVPFADATILDAELTPQETLLGLDGASATISATAVEPQQVLGETIAWSVLALSPESVASFIDSLGATVALITDDALLDVGVSAQVTFLLLQADTVPGTDTLTNLNILSQTDASLSSDQPLTGQLSATLGEFLSTTDVASAAFASSFVEGVLLSDALIPTQAFYPPVTDVILGSDTRSVTMTNRASDALTPDESVTILSIVIRDLIGVRAGFTVLPRLSGFAVQKDRTLPAQPVTLSFGQAFIGSLEEQRPFYIDFSDWLLAGETLDGNRTPTILVTTSVDQVTWVPIDPSFIAGSEVTADTNQVTVFLGTPTTHATLGSYYNVVMATYTTRGARLQATMPLISCTE